MKSTKHDSKVLPPIESKVRVSVDDTVLYTGTSKPSVYAFIKTGQLESYVEGGRRWVTVRSILRLRLPPNERPALPTPPEFVAIKITPVRGARAAA
jgi:hypothetical protein